MELTTTKIEHRRKQAQQELHLLRLALAHVHERLQTLTPTINTTPRFYRQLMDERDDLTRRVNDVILSVYGTDFTSETNSLYLIDGRVIPIVGSVRARV